MDLVRVIGYLICCLLLCQAAYAEDVTVEITLQNHIFSPSEIYVPESKKIILVINNLDPTVEEFDSPSLKREKILRSNSVTRVILAPLSPGRYEFTGEFHQETAKGVVIVGE